MLRSVLAVVLLCLAGCASGLPSEQQDLVDRSTLTVQAMMTSSQGRDARPLLQRATGVLVCPQLFKASFLLGGAGGQCVLAGRGPNGWSSPAFYQISSGSLGLQAGIQDSELMLIVLTKKGMQALIDNQFKIGANAGVAFTTLGAGIEGATTAALRADIVAFARSRGLFLGVSLDGSIISVKSAWNAAYYGRPIGAQEIVLEGQGNNPGAAPLREMLARFSGPG